ncbi:hypothetical protein pdam_00004236 [Pocillopora damicornis]|uniref:WD repeat domain phosphoinositide-interacting protein 2 n=1 Tax=Pocillopora damicornis TaxID=46731 RepID=A0A3M6UGB3_POCDA|nr:hypothetical protein pdam_00004236 [Pocillopora damicornis]
MNLAAYGGDPTGNLLCVNFNQDCSSLAVGSKAGYKLFSLNSVEKLEEIYDYAIVSLSAPRKLKVCHFKKGTEICNYSYPNTILAVRLNRVRLLVVLEESLYIHNIRDMKVLHTIRDTPPNPSGLCALSVNSDNCYLAYPGSNQIGEVQIFDCVNLGTVIRVFAIPDGIKLYEFRRGVKRCVTINSLAFSHDSLFLCASSNTETVHIFKLEAPKKEPPDEASGLMGYFGKALSPSSYLPVHVAEVFNQERAFASVRLPQAGLRNVCAIAMIGKLPRLLVSSADGYLYIYNIDPEEGGDCTLLKQHRLIGQTEGLEKPSEEESTSAELNPSPTNKEEESQDTRVRASSQNSQNSPTTGVCDPTQAMTAFGDLQGPGNLRLDDETEYPPLTVHNE